MKYQEPKITTLKNGKSFCRVPTGYKIDENGKKHYCYKAIYGLDRNDILIKRAEYIDSEINKINNINRVEHLFTSKIEDWLYNSKYGTVRSTTFDRLEGIYLHQVLPAIDNKYELKLSEVSEKDIRRILDYNLNKGYSYSTLIKVYRLLTEFFDYATISNNLKSNPMKLIKFYRKEFVVENQNKLKQKREEVKNNLSTGKAVNDSDLILAMSKLKFHSQIDQSDILCLTEDEILKIKTAANETFSNGKPKLKQAKFFLFILNTGLRAGEAGALKYEDFDFNNNTVFIDKNLVSVKQRDSKGKATGKRSSIITSVKTSESKKLLVLSQVAIDIIKELKEQEPEDYNGYIVHGENGKPINGRALEKRFYNLLRLAKVEKRGLHSLRHTYATKIYELTNGDSKFVSEQLRHRDPHFTEKTYIHQSKLMIQNRLKNFEI